MTTSATTPDTSHLPTLLRYHDHGTPLDPNGGGRKLLDVVMRIHTEPGAQVVLLEPKDATRYTLLITSLTPGQAKALGWGMENTVLHVSRLAGGEVIGSYVLELEEPYQRGQAAIALGGRNEWSRTVMRWYLDCLEAESRKVRNAVRGLFVRD